MLLALLGTAGLLAGALLLASWWHRGQAARAVVAEQIAARMLASWAARDPEPAELTRLARLTAVERRAFLGFCARTLPPLEEGSVERARDALHRTGLLQREVTRLHHRSAWHRAEACRILGRLGRTGAVSPLVERLGDHDATVRREAIGALADLRAVDAIGAIAAAIEARGGWNDLLAVMALVRMGPGAVSRIGALLESSGSPAMTKALLQVTGRLGAAADPALVRILAAHADPEIRIEALRALGFLAGEEDSVAVCLAAMDGPEWPARALAARSLGRLGDARAVPRLERAMGDTAYWVRHHVAEALAGLGQPGEAALRRGLVDENPFVRDMAAQALYMQAVTRGESA